MSDLKNQLTEDMKNAMRAKDTVTLGTIRFMMSEIRNFEIDNGEQDDAGIQKLIAKQVKQMKDAMAEFASGGREDLVAEETQKVAVLESYLPKQISDDELKTLISQAIEEAPEKNMGAVMKIAREKVGDKADGGRVSAMVKQLLG
jgi:uncharacterized protein YqeY